MNLQDHHSLTHSFKVHDVVQYTLLGIGKICISRKLYTFDSIVQLVMVFYVEFSFLCYYRVLYYIKVPRY